MADAPKTFDVSKPGKAQPDASSKPVIVTNKPEVKDPMMAAGVVSVSKPVVEEAAAPADEVKPAEVVAQGSSRQKIAPLSDKEKSDAGVATDSDESKDKSADDKTTEQDSAIVDAVAEQAEAKKAEKKEGEADVAKQELVQKLTESKQYNVSIGIESGKKKSNVGAITAVVLVLILAVGYLALDGGLVKVNGFEVPYHIIGSKK